MKFLALAAIAAAVSLDIEEDRSLGGEAKNEASAWKNWLNATRNVMAKKAVYEKLLAKARHEEKELQREINETKAQEEVVIKANKKADAARKAVLSATWAAHKAFEAYMNAHASDALSYSR